MGMSDQYDDGRYDGTPETERYNAKTDQWLPGGDPRLPKYRGVEAPGGWCVPAEQVTEPFTFPRIQRGGIKYPTPTKETHMPEKLTKAQIDHELRLNTELMESLRKSRAFLEKQKATAIPARPPASYTMFTVSVRFKMRGRRYQFLILRYAETYFTTGTSPAHQRFDSWDALMAWLEGPDVYDHSDIEILKSSGLGVSFDSGQVEKLDKAQVPF